MENQLSQIPSELIESHLVKFMSNIIESVGHGLQTPASAKEDLTGVQRFVSMSCGVHARLAVNNEFDKLLSLSNKQMKKICMQVVKRME